MEKQLKVLLLNGSPRKEGNIALALGEMEKVFEGLGVAYETIRLGREDIRGCIADGEFYFIDIVSCELLDGIENGFTFVLNLDHRCTDHGDGNALAGHALIGGYIDLHIS